MREVLERLCRGASSVDDGIGKLLATDESKGNIVLTQI